MKVEAMETGMKRGKMVALLTLRLHSGIIQPFARRKSEEGFAPFFVVR